MKIYIDNYQPMNLAKKMAVLQKYQTAKKEQWEIHSEEGIYLIDNNHIYQLHIVEDKQDRIEYSKNLCLIIDYSKIEKKQVYRIPSEHHSQLICYQTYKINKSSKTTMVIKTLDNSIMDFYFEMEMNETLRTPLIQEELNNFLELLY
jgi:hypothetical protein